MLLLSAASFFNVLPTHSGSNNTRSHIKPLLLHCISSELPLRPSVQTNAAFSSSSSSSSSSLNGIHLLCVAGAVNSDQEDLVPSASAVAAAIRQASTSPVEIAQRIEHNGKDRLVLPSPDFQRLCAEQLDLFRAIVDRDAILSVSLYLLLSRSLPIFLTVRAEFAHFMLNFLEFRACSVTGIQRILMISRLPTRMMAV